MLRKANLAVLVSGGGTNLEHLLLAQERGELPHGKIAVVLSSSADAYALQRAVNHGVPGFSVPRKGSTQEAFEAALAQKLGEYRIDAIVLAGFLPILSAGFVRTWPDRILNVHPSLIASFCGRGFYGLSVHEAALARGVKLTGATVHLVNEVPDGGRILLQKAVEVRADDTPDTLQKRVMEQAEWILLPQAAEMLCRELIDG